MPFVKEPHFCKPPLWPRLYRVGTVWECPRCKAKYNNVRNSPHYTYDKSKSWKRLD